MFRVKLITLGVGLCLLPFLSGTSGYLEAAFPALVPGICGTCNNHDQWTCEDWLGMSADCHAWVDEAEGPDPRCTHPHTTYGEGYIGTGTCSEEHPGTCGDPGCGSEDLDEDLMAAVLSSDIPALEGLLGEYPSAWVEFNQDRKAVQILTRCAADPVGSVVRHIPVERESVSFWTSKLPQSSLSVLPLLELGEGF